MPYMKQILLLSLLGLLLFTPVSSEAQNSVAHEWIEINLEAVRKDFARPTVHSRNLWHNSIAIYDAWAAYDTIADTYFLGKELGDYECAFDGIPVPADINAAREEAISFAAYRMIHHRYTGSPGQVNTFLILDTMMTGLGYDPSFTSTDYSSGSPAALGNYISEQLIAAALMDGSNEALGYLNEVYEPVNSDLYIDEAHFIGNPDIDSLNRWQPLGLTLFCDQGGNTFTTTPDFLGPEWGNVIPFALHDSVMSIKTREDIDWKVFHDPGAPPRIGLEGNEDTELYRWGMDLVAKWSSHLDPDDPVMWDISPASIGNIPLDSFPTSFEDYPNFYDRDNGGDASQGHDVNPYTDEPYTPQIVPRGDYSRILAEFWADGPDSETPPGHWFDIYNEISQYPEFTWKWKGEGEELDHLEYDIKTYFTLGGGLHDACVAAWSVKGYYDYIRPVSSIRAMAELGQSTSDTLPNFHPAGLKLEPGFMELVQLGDTIFNSDTIMLAGPEYVGELKMMCWLGPLVEDTCISGFAPNYQTEVGHVGWKLALDWWPYQRPTFVTPPFAGYVSGHSTFSRAAAEIMTYTTGDRFFPGGMGTFFSPQNDYLVFEEGPSVDVTLQWATYQDASDQCSLSRIWGGIHPPADDIPGRLIGYEVGNNAYALAERYFRGGTPRIEELTLSDAVITDDDIASTFTINAEFNQRMNTSLVPTFSITPDLSSSLNLENFEWDTDSTFVLTYTVIDANEDLAFFNISLDSAINAQGNIQEPFSQDSIFYLDTENPVAAVTLDESDPFLIYFKLEFSETMDTSMTPALSFPVEDPLSGAMTFNASLSEWPDTLNNTYLAYYNVATNAQLHDIDVNIGLAEDSLGNQMTPWMEVDFFSIDHNAPETVSFDPSSVLLSDSEVGDGTFEVVAVYNEAMDISSVPSIQFFGADPLINSLTANALSSQWTDEFTYAFVFDLTDAEETLNSISAEVSGGVDLFGNVQSPSNTSLTFDIDTENPQLASFFESVSVISDQEVGMNTVVVNLMFSEDMDTLTNPVLSFPLEDPGMTLMPSGGLWVDSMSYSARFDVVDEGLLLFGIDIEVNGAIDAAGNNMLDFTAMDVFDIDMENPHATLASSSPSPITDNSSDVWSIDFSFDEAMDVGVSPNIDIIGDDVSNTLSLNDLTWSGDQNITAEYQITDADEVLNNLSFEISMAQDTSGNILEQFMTTSVLDIEMENPFVTGIIPSIDLIDNSIFGDNMFNLEVEFSEVMDMMEAPGISFPVEDPSATIMMNGVESTWTSESSYRFSFDVSEGFTTLPDVDVEIAGGTDLVGNPLYVQLNEDLFDIDIVSSLGLDESPVLQLYPNPVEAGQAMILKLTDASQADYISLRDAMGREIRNMDLGSSPASRIILDTSGLSAGNYLIQVYHEDGVSNHQIIVTEGLR